MTGEALHKLRRLVLDVEDSVAHEGVLKHTHFVHWATYYLLHAEKEDLIRILEAGKASQEAHETRAESGVVVRTVLTKPQVKESVKEAEPKLEEVKPQEPSKKAELPPVGKTVATVWTRGKKAGKGSTEGLDRDRPARRKASDTPRRK